MMSHTSGNAALPRERERESACFHNAEMKPSGSGSTLLSCITGRTPLATCIFSPRTLRPRRTTYSLSFLALGGWLRWTRLQLFSSNPPGSQRGGHRLLHIKITFPYQLSVEPWCLMSASCRKAAALNQAPGESCSNLFFINRSFEHTNDGDLTTGSRAPVWGVRTKRPCCISTSLQRPKTKRGNSCVDTSPRATQQNPASRVFNQWKGQRVFLRAHNKTRQIKERLRDTGGGTEVHSLKVMHCKIAFLLGRTFILCGGCGLYCVSKQDWTWCVGVTCRYLSLLEVLMAACRLVKWAPVITCPVHPILSSQPGGSTLPPHFSHLV